uniref:Uncharacterized protein n=1 Tax=Podoviridae sp. ct8Lf7 TaxID=2827723 RepID=A0A8S5S0J4_9CAUD|nr:MAG TPA: hypothetical protein [Podoviridae sp. ct8Lf7]
MVPATEPTALAPPAIAPATPAATAPAAPAVKTHAAATATTAIPAITAVSIFLNKPVCFLLNLKLYLSRNPSDI